MTLTAREDISMTPEATNPDVWFQVGGIAAALLAGAAGYFWTRMWGKQPQPPGHPVLTGIGMAIGDRDQAERQIVMLERIAKALEVIADRRQHDMQETLDELVEQLKQKEMRPSRRRS